MIGNLFRISIVMLFLATPLCSQSESTSSVRNDSTQTTSLVLTAAQDSSMMRFDSSERYDAGDARRVNGWRLGLVCGAAASTVGATYLYLKQTWWKEKTTSFHFDNGADLKYALNLDKFAHFYCGLIVADLFYGSLRWANLSESSAIWLGVGLGAFVQIAIEMKDGFSPRWGFSPYDVGAGIAGSFLYASQHYVPMMKNLDVKFSYYRRSDYYYTHLKTDGTGTWNDDYVNQTYWLSFKINNVLSSSLERYWPDWLAVAVGMGVDETLSGYDVDHPERAGKGNIEMYLALDWDITNILPSKSPVWEAIKHYLNYFKFPAPAIRITPSAIWYGLYF